MSPLHITKIMVMFMIPPKKRRHIIAKPVFLIKEKKRFGRNLHQNICKPTKSMDYKVILDLPSKLSATFTPEMFNGWNDEISFCHMEMFQWLNPPQEIAGLIQGMSETKINLNQHVGVSKNKGTPQIIHLNRVFHYKLSILGSPYFWKHPCRSMMKALEFPNPCNLTISQFFPCSVCSTHLLIYYKGKNHIAIAI